ncbi:hypothetical protein CRUP_017717 [Coryphaenoides rupestris]|nr:hypothetical protein CRUP_017717 [Coryphaenoides rupestris]
MCHGCGRGRARAAESPPGPVGPRVSPPVYHLVPDPESCALLCRGYARHGDIAPQARTPSLMKTETARRMKDTNRFMWIKFRSSGQLTSTTWPTLAACQQEEEGAETTKGCPWQWDNLTCWQAASVGQVVEVNCPELFNDIMEMGKVVRNCTEEGWSEPFPHYVDVCLFDDNTTKPDMYYASVKALYTVGYSTSLVSLTTAMVILCRFRKLHCTRNFIHMNLFVSFILRAVSVFIKDGVLYAAEEDSDHCFEHTVGRLRLAFSASGLDMRIWELLLLRMESWVPPLTPLLARDGCRCCFRSTAKYRFTVQLRHFLLISDCTFGDMGRGITWSLI